jgi:hypothetical protein
LASATMTAEVSMQAFVVVISRPCCRT